MNRVLIILVGLFILGLGGWWGEKKLTRPLSALIPEVLQTKQSQSLAHDSPPQSPTPSLLPPDQSLSTPASSTIPERIVLENPAHTFQTFNNCGPATLSMALGYYGATVSQQELGQKMRPYQNPQGDNDDKTIFSAEFVRWAKEYGLQGESRVNGDIELLQRLTANGFPVVVKTWLEPGDDVGHFRLVKGYDQSQQVIIQDDSYQGKDLEFTSEEFLALWQPFNYNYIVIYKPEQTELLKTILGDAWDEQTAWQMAYDRLQDNKPILRMFNPWVQSLTSGVSP